MTRIVIGTNPGGGGGGTGKVQVDGSSSYIDAPIYVGRDDPAGKGAVEPYAWVDSDSFGTTGLQVVAYGTAANTVRPAGVPNGGVYWIGSGTALPANAQSADLVFLP
jgi:hypothetical protein